MARILETMDRSEFERVVAQTVEAMPASIRRAIANVGIVVEEWPDEETLEMAELDDPAELLGFYYGVPLTERTHEYGLVLPDKISIFRQPILLSCSTDDEVRDCIRNTVRHELGHYFGLSDDRLLEMGVY